MILKKIIFLFTSVFFLISCGEKKPDPFASSSLKKVKFQFKDTDQQKTEIGGKVTLFIPDSIPLNQVTDFIVYWGTSKSESGKKDKLDEASVLSKKGNDLLKIKDDTKIQEKYLLLFLKNKNLKLEGDVKTNETYSGLAIEIKDVYDGPSDLISISNIPDDEKPEKAEPDENGIVVGYFKNIQFKFNDDSISYASKKLLRKKYKSLKNKNTARLLVAGHADERGSDEYNLLLGERRALSVKTYLVALGAKKRNIRIVSLGEEKPLDPAHNKKAWEKNRHVEIKILPPKTTRK